MELRIWAKTFLSIYRCLAPLARSIDAYVDLRAKSCFYKNLSNMILCGTIKVVDDITELTNKKINLINIKCLTERLLSALPEKYARFLVLRYIDGLTFEAIAQNLDLSIRTVLRWNKPILKRCEVVLQGWGYTEEKLKKFVGCENWILNLVDKAKDDDTRHTGRVMGYVVMHEAQKEYKKFLI